MSIAPFEGTLALKGLSESVRSLNKIQKGLGGMVKKELKLIAVPVAGKAQEIARARGLVGKTGNLVRKIKPYATGQSVGIRETATRKGTSGSRGGQTGPFSYPAVWEFGGRGDGERVGPRAFMYPAAKWGQPQAERMLGEALDRLTASS